MKELIENLSLDVFQAENDLLEEYEKLEKMVDDNTGCIGQMVLEEFKRFCVEELCHLKAKRKNLNKLRFLLWGLIRQYHYEESFTNPDEMKKVCGSPLLLPTRLLIKEGNNEMAQKVIQMPTSGSGQGDTV